MKRSMLILFLLLPPSLCFSKENRCGWMENPSPANYWLTDKDGEWTISTQGGGGAAGMDALVEFPKADFIKTNGDYGYGCACITVDADDKVKKISTIYQFRVVPIKQCKNDNALKRKTEDIMAELQDTY